MRPVSGSRKNNTDLALAGELDLDAKGCQRNLSVSTPRLLVIQHAHGQGHHDFLCLVIDNDLELLVGCGRGAAKSDQKGGDETSHDLFPLPVGTEKRYSHPARGTGAARLPAAYFGFFAVLCRRGSILWRTAWILVLLA